MFELEQRKYTFEDFPDRELNVWGRKDTLDFGLLNGVKEYDFKSIFFYNDDTIIDIGAYTGQEILYFMAMGLCLNYYAFEPIKENYAVLEMNIKDNNRCLNADWAINAIGDGMGNVDMYLGGEGDGKWINLYRYMGNIKPPFRSKDKREVMQITLDYIFDACKIRKCKLVKIDAEGAELKILSAASKKTLDKIHYIIGEYHEDITPKQLLKATKGRFKNTIDDSHLFRFEHK